MPWRVGVVRGRGPAAGRRHFNAYDPASVLAIRRGGAMSDAGTTRAGAGDSGLLGRLASAPGALYLLGIMGIILTVWTPGFFGATNLTNVGLQVAVLIIVACGMTLVILTEGIDLSLGPVLGLCGVCSAIMIVIGKVRHFAGQRHKGAGFPKL
jgi:predicted ABC-type sugar transport system permease subunit